MQLMLRVILFIAGMFLIIIALMGYFESSPHQLQINRRIYLMVVLAFIGSIMPLWE